MRKIRVSSGKIYLAKLDLKKVAIPVALMVLAGLSYYAPERSQQIKLTS